MEILGPHPGTTELGILALAQNSVSDKLFRYSEEPSI
jgi:hypothetical protein